MEDWKSDMLIECKKKYIFYDINMFLPCSDQLWLQDPP